MSHRRGSFQEDWNDLLTRFAHQRKHDDLHREEMLEQAQQESLESHLWERFDPHQALFEGSQVRRPTR